MVIERPAGQLLPDTPSLVACCHPVFAGIALEKDPVLIVPKTGPFLTGILVMTGDESMSGLTLVWLCAGRQLVAGPRTRGCGGQLAPVAGLSGSAELSPGSV